MWAGDQSPRRNGRSAKGATPTWWNASRPLRAVSALLGAASLLRRQVEDDVVPGAGPALGRGPVGERRRLAACEQVLDGHVVPLQDGQQLVALGGRPVVED